jgi:hypothetical protein
MENVTSKLGRLVADHGERWEIEYSQAPAAWAAVERPTPTAMHVLVALDLDELRDKIQNAERSPG